MAACSPYGSWKSPISSALVAESGIRLSGVQVDKSGKHPDRVYWSELRPAEGGRIVVCSKDGDSQPTEWTPEGFNARTLVHEYGGGATFVHSGVVYFSNFKDQRLYRQTSPDAAPEAITPADSGWRYADGEFCEKLNIITAVREDHGVVERAEAKEAVNTVVAIHPDTQEQFVLASGLDFYASPRVSPDGKKICWTQWNHPNMPWDSTEIWQADMKPDGKGVMEAHKVCGGDDVSVMYPRWSPSGELYYISDVTDWWNLYHVTPSGDHVAIAPQEKEIGNPHWQFGTTPYDFDADKGVIITSYGMELGVYDMGSGKYHTNVDTGFKTHVYLVMGGKGCAYCIASSPTQFPCVIRVNYATSKTDTVKSSKEVPVDTGYLSIPEEVTFPTAGGDKAHAYFYPPKNKDFTAPEGTLPPLLVRAHGGPTSSCSSTLNLNIQYFTSRGVGLLDVNYRGSTGYGTIYRNKLRQNWGIHDVDDCCHGALYLAGNGKVDKKRLAIDGGSAGGYTTLASLAFRDTFHAGVSHYGVGDLEALAKDTHKFESRYLDTIVGPYPKTESTYKERSPMNHVDKLSCPIALFQGGEDKIVPPNQAEMMFEAVKNKGLPCAFVLFPDEQHGFRKAENIRKALDGEFYFLGRVFGYEPADKGGEIDIENMD
ncbi:APEH [Branchiostoma lanceolatum]|uniref:APEH protein n=1 Tax=Branchiostoma lanceolatum TaxID=7740 RepID=A0A8S4MPT9_BRALA|nr:APEH [Branchiostoma lanceolatum]